MAGSETQIKEMQRQLESMAAREQLLIQALNDALEAADRRLLDEVRNVTVEHEARRVTIMTELQRLAGRIGAFPISEEPATTIEYDAVPQELASRRDNVEALPTAEPATLAEKGGDWRKAAANIGKELDFYVSRAGTQRSG